MRKCKEESIIGGKRWGGGRGRWFPTRMFKQWRRSNANFMKPDLSYELTPKRTGLAEGKRVGNFY